MRIGYVATVAILLLIPLSGVLATPITLDKAMELAVANNKELQVKRLAIKTAESDRLKARQVLPSNPELELEAVSGALTSSSGEGTLQIGLSQEIELGGQRKHRTSIADSRIELSRLEVSTAEQSLRRDVRAAYYSLLLAQQRLSFVRFVDSLATSLRDTAAIRVKSGTRPTSEFTFLDLDLAVSRTTVNNAEAAIGEAKNQLMQLLGGGTDTYLEAVGEIAYQPFSMSEDSLVSLAAVHRSELSANRFRQSASADELALARSERMPNLTITGFYSRQSSSFSSGDFIGNNGSIQGLKSTDHLLGIKLSMPLPLIDKRRPEIARSTSDIDVLNATEQSLTNQVRYEVQSAYRVLKISENTLEMLRQVQPESDSLFQMLQSAYAQGRITVSDYLSQKDRLLHVRLNLLDAYKTYVNAQTECERAVGLDWNQMQQGELK